MGLVIGPIAAGTRVVDVGVHSPGNALDEAGGYHSVQMSEVEQLHKRDTRLPDDSAAIMAQGPKDHATSGFRRRIE